MISPKPGRSLSQTAAVASGVTSRLAGPVPPVVTTRQQPAVVGHAPELGLDERPLVGDDLVVDVEGRREPLQQQGDARLAGGVLVDPGAGPVGHVDDSDADGHVWRRAGPPGQFAGPRPEMVGARTDLVDARRRPPSRRNRTPSAWAAGPPDSVTAAASVGRHDDRRGGVGRDRHVERERARRRASIRWRPARRASGSWPSPISGRRPASAASGCGGSPAGPRRARCPATSS